jgi:hypothetical protein
LKLIVPLCLAALSASCVAKQAKTEAARKRGESTEGKQLVIDFQYGFRSNHVDLRLDGRPVFTGVISTDDRIGLAHSVRFPMFDAKNRLEALLLVDDSKQQTFDIRMAKGLYVGFYKDLDDGKIRIEQSRRPFLYY